MEYCFVEDAGTHHYTSLNKVESYHVSRIIHCKKIKIMKDVSFKVGPCQSFINSRPVRIEAMGRA